METAVFKIGFLLLAFVTDTHLSPDPRLVFDVEGVDAKFHAEYVSWVDYYVLYRVSTIDGDLMLINCSQPERAQPMGYNVECQGHNRNRYTFLMKNLSVDHTGDYRAEGWVGGNVTEHHQNFSLTVCGKYDPGRHWRTVLSTYGESAILCDSMENGSSVQLYRCNWYENSHVLILDTNSTRGPLLDKFKGRLHVDLNNSMVILSDIRHTDMSLYCCTVWRQSQCQAYNSITLGVIRRQLFAYENDTVTVPCHLKGESSDHVGWDVNYGKIWIQVNLTHRQEEMYMVNGSQIGDYSLIIPSISKWHSGIYECLGQGLISGTDLYVCSKSSPLRMMFSPGDTVLLDITGHANDSGSLNNGLHWYRQKKLQPQVLILDFFVRSVSLPEDLKDRVDVSNILTNRSLIIYNLTAKDSGVYTWRFFGWDKANQGKVCSEGSIHLVYMDPFGVQSPFYRAYASLMGCGLLGLVSAVIWLKMRSRRGEQTSACQGREGQQSRDEDLYDDVMEMAESGI